MITERIEIHDNIPSNTNYPPLPLGINNPEIWGPSAWKFLHIMSISYPNKPDDLQKEAAKNFILSLPLMLPCYECSKHCEKFVNEYWNKDKLESTISSKEGMFSFFWEMHNKVNMRNGKKILSLEEAKSLYQLKYKCKVVEDKKCSLKMLFLVTVITLVIGILVGAVIKI
jgi:hypothetical protein